MNITYWIYKHRLGYHLNIEGYRVGLYPISYTVEECLEDFCHQVQWELDTFIFTEYTSFIGGMMNVERPFSGILYGETLRIAEHRLRHETN